MSSTFLIRRIDINFLLLQFILHYLQYVSAYDLTQAFHYNLYIDHSVQILDPFHLSDPSSDIQQDCLITVYFDFSASVVQESTCHTEAS